ncbi:hypothetical protein B0H19DRAFT_1162639 [Mycena capillaripes]|nr:hypothetical protein B0H19DRAFT_1162639 [Mycena capillaripes]
MPPRRAKANVSAPAVPSAQKRRAEDTSASQKDAPPAKKARQSAPKAAPKKVVEVIEVSSDSEAGSEDDKAVSSKKIPASTAVDASNSDSESNGESNEDSANEDEEEDGSPRLPQKVRERLDYIATHTDGLTSTYLKFITRELDGYMGKGGCNSDVAADIANHCAFQAQLGRSDLGYEKRLVKRVYRMCYGGCGESDDDSDDEYDDDYEIPKEIQGRLVHCLEMLEGFDLKALRKVIKNLSKYTGPHKGELENVLDAVMEHLDDMAARKSDVVAEAAMIEKIRDKVARN